MITKEDILHLAELARLELKDDEATKLTTSMSSILDYVGQVNTVDGSVERVVPTLRNVMRLDVPTHTAGEYTESILSNAPAREGNFLKVKKIL